MDSEEIAVAISCRSPWMRNSLKDEMPGYAGSVGTPGWSTWTLKYRNVWPGHLGADGDGFHREADRRCVGGLPFGQQGPGPSVTGAIDVGALGAVGEVVPRLKAERVRGDLEALAEVDRERCAEVSGGGVEVSVQEVPRLRRLPGSVVTSPR